MFNFGLMDYEYIGERDWSVTLHRIQGKGFDPIVGTYTTFTDFELDAEYYGIVEGIL
jgi:hypothetical protein